ncbi:MAG: TatD family hydrolase [Calditrichia bacterium]
MLTDTHTHLHFDLYAADVAEVVQRAREAGVERILTLGTDWESSFMSVELSQRFSPVFAAVGIHPTDVHKSKAEDLPAIKELAATEKKVVAIGEIGLDLHWKEVPLQDQIPVFEKMLELAEELDLPVVIHNRNAQAEMRQFFLERGITRLRGVMHSFSGSEEDAAFYLERGLNISFTGVITFKNFKKIPVVKRVPPNRLLLETDSPFLTPVPYRGQRNEPAYVRHVAEKLAEIHEMPFEEMCRITSQNARDLFKW